MTMTNSISQAYGAAQGLKALSGDMGKLAPTRSQEVGASQGFGQLVDTAMINMERQAVATDAQAVSLAKGEADIVDVVTAVAETELALETLVSVRDQVVTAYEEIMRMPI